MRFRAIYDVFRLLFVKGVDFFWIDGRMNPSLYIWDFVLFYCVA